MSARRLAVGLVLVAACAPRPLERKVVLDARTGSWDAGRTPDSSRRPDASSAPDAGATPDLAAEAPGRADAAPTSDAAAAPDLPAADARSAATADSAPARRRVLQVVGGASLTAGDLLLKGRLERRGFVVTAVSGELATAATAADSQLVLVSESVQAGQVGARFRDLRLPVVTLDPNVLDDMGMTAGSATDFGFTGGQTQIAITAPSHPLAAGKSGTVTVSSAVHSIMWGLPAAAAARVATVVGNPNQVTIFGYAAGAAMVGLAAPARRVGWFAGDLMAASLTAQGLELFDAAIDWALAK
jgi:hypothetical protein